MLAVATLPSRLILRRRQSGGAVELAGSWPPTRVADRGAVVSGADHAPAGHGEQDCERHVKQQLGDLCFGGGDLAVKLGQQPKIVGQDLAKDPADPPSAEEVPAAKELVRQARAILVGEPVCLPTTSQRLSTHRRRKHLTV